MGQKYTIPVKLLNFFLGHPKRGVILSAMRLFFYIKINFGAYLAGRSRKKLLIHFSQYELNKYLKWLDDRGYIEIDSSGGIRPMSTENFLRFVFPNDYNRKGITFKKIDLPSSVLKNSHDWKSWVKGHGIAWLTVSLRSGETKQKARHFAADNTGINKEELIILSPGRTVSEHTKVAQGLSCSLIQRRFGIAKSTASVWRERGQIFGYKTVRVARKIKLHTYPQTIESDDEAIVLLWRSIYRLRSQESPYMGAAPVQTLWKKRAEIGLSRKNSESGFMQDAGILYCRNGFVVEEQPALIVFNRQKSSFWVS
jgi:hypothetical protein